MGHCSVYGEHAPGEICLRWVSLFACAECETCEAKHDRVEVGVLLMLCQEGFNLFQRLGSRKRLHGIATFVDYGFVECGAFLMRRVTIERKVSSSSTTFFFSNDCSTGSGSKACQAGMAERKAVSREPPRSAQMTVPTERDVETTADEPMTMSSVKSKLPDSVVTLGTAAKSALLSVGPESVVLPSLVLSVVPVSVVSVDISVLSVVSAQRATASQHGVTPEVALSMICDRLRHRRCWTLVLTY